MQRLRILMAFAMLLTLAGCQGSPPQPAAVQPAAASPAATAPPNANLNIGLDGSKIEVHPDGFTTGSVITWNYILPFTLDFTNTNKMNPCQEPVPDPSLPLEYQSSPSSSSNTLTCTLKPGLSRKGPFYYVINPQPSRSKQGKPERKRFTAGSHCEGCVIDSPQ
jgi:hypothetical protein